MRASATLAVTVAAVMVLLLCVAPIGTEAAKKADQGLRFGTRARQEILCATCQAMTSELELALNQTARERTVLTGSLGRKKDYTKSDARRADVMTNLCYFLNYYDDVAANATHNLAFTRREERKPMDQHNDKDYPSRDHSEKYYSCSEIMEHHEALLEKVIFETDDLNTTFCMEETKICNLPPKHHLEWVTKPESATGGVPFDVQPSVRIVDHEGNLVTNEDTDFMVERGDNGTSTLGVKFEKTRSKGGIASWTGVKVDTMDANFTIRVISESGSILATPDSPLPVRRGPAGRLKWRVEPDSFTYGGKPLSVDMVVTVTDLGGNLVEEGGDVDVTLRMKAQVDVKPNQGKLKVVKGKESEGGALTQRSVNGQAVFPHLTITDAGGYFVWAMSKGLKSAKSRLVKVNGPARALNWGKSPPAFAKAGEDVPSLIEVSLLDSKGDHFETDQYNVTLKVLSGPGEMTATEEGNIVATSEKGLAAFSGIVFDKPGTYELVAVCEDEEGINATEVASVLVHGEPAKLHVLRAPKEVISGEQLDNENGTVVVQVLDKDGLPVAEPQLEVRMETVKAPEGKGSDIRLDAQTHIIKTENGEATFKLHPKIAGAFELGFYIQEREKHVDDTFHEIRSGDEGTAKVTVLPGAKHTLQFLDDNAHFTGSVLHGAWSSESESTTSNTNIRSFRVGVVDKGHNVLTELDPEVEVTLGYTGSMHSPYPASYTKKGSKLLKAMTVNGVATFTDLEFVHGGSWSLNVSSKAVPEAKDIRSPAVKVVGPPEVISTYVLRHYTQGAVIPALSISIQDKGSSNMPASGALAANAGKGLPKEIEFEFTLFSKDGERRLSPELKGSADCVSIHDYNFEKFGIDDLAPGKYSLRVRAKSHPNLAPYISDQFEVAGKPDRVVIMSYPNDPAVNASEFNLTAGTIWPRGLEVQVQDKYGNRITNFAGKIKLEIDEGPARDGLSTPNEDNPLAIYTGEANFTQIKVQTSGKYILKASVLGNNDEQTEALKGVLPGRTGEITVKTGPAKKLKWLQEMPTEGKGDGSEWTVAPRVSLVDLGGNVVTDGMSPIALVLESSGTGSNSGKDEEVSRVVVYSKDGVASHAAPKFTHSGVWKVKAVCAATTVCQGIDPLTHSVHVKGPASKVVIENKHQRHGIMGKGMGGLRAMVKDAAGNVMEEETFEVTLEVASGKGASVMAEQLTVTTERGVAQFDAFRVEGATGIVRLQATSPGLKPGKSSKLRITGPAVKVHVEKLDVTEIKQNEKLKKAIVAYVVDADGNYVVPYTTGADATDAHYPGNGQKHEIEISLKEEGASLRLQKPSYDEAVRKASFADVAFATAGTVTLVASVPDRPDIAPFEAAAPILVTPDDSDAHADVPPDAAPEEEAAAGDVPSVQEEL